MVFPLKSLINPIVKPINPLVSREKMPRPNPNRRAAVVPVPWCLALRLPGAARHRGAGPSEGEPHGLPCGAAAQGAASPWLGAVADGRGPPRVGSADADGVMVNEF